MDGDLFPAEPLLSLRDSLRIDVGQDDSSAGPYERTGNRQTESLSRSGDEDAAARDTHGRLHMEGESVSV